MTSTEQPAADDLDTLRSVLRTGRYQTWRPEHGIPLRTTVGHPRFWRGPNLINVPVVAPFGIFKNPDYPTTDEQRAAYLDRLDGHAVELVNTLAAIARQYPGQALVALCFENVAVGEECHRRWFANWCADRLGIDVPEIAPAAHQVGLSG